MIYKKFELQDFDKLDEAMSKNELQSQEILESADEIMPYEQPEQDVIDIEAIAKKAYDDGFMSCQQELQPIIDELKIKENLHEILKLKLLEITSFNLEKDYKAQVSKLIVDIIGQIVQKLFLSFPVNFESMFRNKIIDILNKHHKSGTIKIITHPSKINYVEEFINKEKFSQENKNDENYNIISDEALGNNDCVLEWESNRFEFQVSAVEKEISEILEQFKTIEV